MARVAFGRPKVVAFPSEPIDYLRLVSFYQLVENLELGTLHVHLEEYEILVLEVVDEEINDVRGVHLHLLALVRGRAFRDRAAADHLLRTQQTKVHQGRARGHSRGDEGVPRLAGRHLSLCEALADQRRGVQRIVDRQRA